MIFLNNKLYKNTQKGFTLVELLTVLVIILVISVITIANLPSINAQQELELAAQDLALSIREMQYFGTTGVEETPIVTQDPYASFGIILEGVETSPTLDYSNTSIRFYVDTNKNAGYDGLDITLREFKGVDGKYMIKEIICSINGSDEACGYVLDADIIFDRVIIEPTIDVTSTVAPYSYSNISYIKFILSNTAGDKWITVWDSGQITISKP